MFITRNAVTQKNISLELAAMMLNSEAENPVFAVPIKDYILTCHYLGLDWEFLDPDTFLKDVVHSTIERGELIRNAKNGKSRGSQALSRATWKHYQDIYAGLREANLGFGPTLDNGDSITTQMERKVNAAHWKALAAKHLRSISASAIGFYVITFSEFADPALNLPVSVAYAILELKTFRSSFLDVMKSSNAFLTRTNNRRYSNGDVMRHVEAIANITVGDSSEQCLHRLQEITNTFYCCPATDMDGRFYGLSRLNQLNPLKEQYMTDFLQKTIKNLRKIDNSGKVGCSADERSAMFAGDIKHLTRFKVVLPKPPKL